MTTAGRLAGFVATAVAVLAAPLGATAGETPPGASAKPWFVVFYQASASCCGGQLPDSHVEWLQEQAGREHWQAAGAFPDFTMSLAVFQAESEAAARTAVQAEPMFARGRIKPDLRPWNPELGRQPRPAKPTGLCFAVVFEPGPQAPKGKPLAKESLAQHQKYWQERFAQKQVMMSGAFGDASGGLAIVTATDEPAAVSLVAHDPAVDAGLLKANVQPWPAAIDLCADRTQVAQATAP